MNSTAITVPVAPAAAVPIPSLANKVLGIGLAAAAVTLIGGFVSDPHKAATGWLVGLVFWTAVAIGMLMLVLIHHVFDAMWATVVRRQFEHCLAAFKWLALLFVPLFIGSLIGPKDLVWPWLNPAHPMVKLGKTVATDVDYFKKDSLLNFHSLVIWTAIFFGLWIWFSARLRKASFTQDTDGDPKWTVKNRFTAGMGIPLTALSLTFAAILWVKSLEYHWFSTIYGVWYFATCMRAAYSIGVIIMLWLYARGDYRGIMHDGHLHSIGQMMLTFTVFWGYICFAQYFLIWNANVPEETFWYNVREYKDWWWIGMVLVFGHFLMPFCALLSYRFKVSQENARGIAGWVVAGIVLNLCRFIPGLEDTGRAILSYLALVLWLAFIWRSIGSIRWRIVLGALAILVWLIMELKFGLGELLAVGSIGVWLFFTLRSIRAIAWWILIVIFLDCCWNVLPAMKDSNGNAQPFVSLGLVWSITSTIAVGGICIWAYLRSFATTKLLPIRDPRVGECLTYHG